MVAIVFWAPVGGILSSLLAYPYGGLAMTLAYIGGFMAFSLITGLFALPNYVKDKSQENMTSPDIGSSASQ